MEEKPFLDKSLEPTDGNLKKVLSSTFTYYKELLKKSEIFFRQWSYANRNGWIQKVFDKKKALFYLIPYSKEFRLSLAIRNNEKTIIMKDQEFDYLKEEL